MQRSLSILLTDRINANGQQVPCWNFQYQEVDDQGNGRQATLYTYPGSDLEARLEQMIAEVKAFQPDALPDALSQAKARKLAALDFDYQQQERTGWDSGQGHLGLSASDVALLSGAFALAKEAAALGLPLPKLITLENNSIAFASIQEMTGLLLRYGAARAELSEIFAARRRAVAAATTVEDVDHA